MGKVENVSEVECDGDCRLSDRRKKTKVVIDLTSDSDEPETDNKGDQGTDGIRVYTKRESKDDTKRESKDDIEEVEVKDNGVENGEELKVEGKENGEELKVEGKEVVVESKDEVKE